MKKSILFLSFLVILHHRSSAQAMIEMPEKKYPTSVAVIIDSASYAHVKPEVMAYKRMLEGTQGLSAYVVVYNWKKPEEVRASLRGLYRRKPVLEGALLVGDIPIPMIRDAQHLTSVFKMDQRVSWQRSSVPSDRFYDDFHLVFNFIKRDSAKSGYFYYSLSPGSPQQIRMNIYTSRVKPPVAPGIDKYELLRRWFVQRVQESATPNPLDHLFVYTGYGYYSESLAAWGGEQLALKDQLPHLFQPGNEARFLNFRMEESMKPVLLSQLQREDMDLAIFHDHGDATSQLISGYPDVSNPQPSIDNIRRYLRSKIQSAQRKKQDTTEAKKHFAALLDLPLSWTDNALSDSVKMADSLYEAGQQISTEDLSSVRTNARMVYMDACDNGSFHLDDYMAGRYLFSGGKTAVVLANSVGVLQDIWPDEMLGLLQKGVRAGNWFKQAAYLESHLLGDPTYAFSTDSKDDLNRHIVLDTVDTNGWAGLLRDSPDADVRALALSTLARLKGDSLASLLKQTYFSASSLTLRMESLKLLERMNSPETREVLQAAVADPYELVRRLAAYYIGARGDSLFIPALVHAVISGTEGERVEDRMKITLSQMDSRMVLAAIEKQISADRWLVNSAQVRKTLTDNQLATQKRLTAEAAVITDKGLPLKKRLFSISAVRATNYHVLVPEIVKVAADSLEEAGIRIASLEALSWFRKSYQTPVIVEACSRIEKETANNQEIRNAALRTRVILQADR